MSVIKMQKAVLLVLSCLACPSITIAQQSNGGGIDVGPGKAYPSLEVKSFYDDNLLSQPANELETWGWGVAPGVSYELSDNIKRLTARWLLDAGYYDSSSIDNYVDNFLSADFTTRPTDRFSAGLKGGFKDSHDPRGTGRSEGVGVVQTDPDEWHAFDVEGNAGYGLEAASARVEGTVGYITKSYDNNRAATYVRDRDDVYASGRFFYRIGPKTSLVTEGRIADFQYDQTAPGSPTLDSTVYKVFGGVTWEATAKTTGSIRIGYMKKDFDALTRRDDSSFAWEAGISWEPRTYSTFRLDTARNFEETNGIGDLIRKDTISVSWIHTWNDRVRTNAHIDYSNDSYTPTTREDDVVYGGVSLDYALRRWLIVTGAYRYEDRDSNTNLYDYQRNIFTVSIRLTL